MNYERPKQTTVTLTRSIQARPEAIYDIWLDATSPGGPWFGSQKVIIDARVDGLFYHSLTHAGREWAHYGRFVVLDRPAIIEHTWVSEGTRGLETVVTITLTPAGERTTVQLRHAGVPDDEFGRMHQEGWSWVLSSIEQQFSQRSG